MSASATLISVLQHARSRGATSAKALAAAASEYYSFEDHEAGGFELAGMTMQVAFSTVDYDDWVMLLGTSHDGIYLVEREYFDTGDVCISAAFLPVTAVRGEDVTDIFEFSLSSMPFGRSFLNQLHRVPQSAGLLSAEAARLEDLNMSLALEALTAHRLGMLTAPLRPVTTLSMEVASLVWRSSYPSQQLHKTARPVWGTWRARAPHGYFVAIGDGDRSSLLYMADDGTLINADALPRTILCVAENLWYQPVDPGDEAHILDRVDEGVEAERGVRDAAMAALEQAVLHAEQAFHAAEWMATTNKLGISKIVADLRKSWIVPAAANN